MKRVLLFIGEFIFFNLDMYPPPLIPADGVGVIPETTSLPVGATLSFKSLNSPTLLFICSKRLDTFSLLSCQ